VYLGEVACPIRSRFWANEAVTGKVRDELTGAGKEVYASSLILTVDREEHLAFAELARRLGRIEINSPSFLGLAHQYPAVAGAALNVYNSASACFLAKHACRRIVLPCELSLPSIASIAGACAVPIEIIVHGHVPIAISCTCHTVRSLGRDAGDCGELCRRYPEGMVLQAEDRPMLRIEGPQTLSAGTCCLVEYLPQLAAAGVDTVRIIPQWDHTCRIVRIYRDVLDGRLQGRQAVQELKYLSFDALCNGWLLGKAGWIYESPN